MKLKKKCKFTLDGKKYIYLARCIKDSKAPELFLVHWSQAKENIINLEYQVSQLSKKEELVMRSDEHSHLEFTLRSDEKIPSKL